MRPCRVGVAFVAAALSTPATAQVRDAQGDIAGYALRVSAIRTADSVVADGEVVRARSGNRLVLAELEGSARARGVLLTTATLLAAYHDSGISTAFALAFAEKDGRLTWTRAEGGQRLLYRYVPAGAVFVTALFEVPAHISSIRITLPQQIDGESSIAPH